MNTFHVVSTDHANLLRTMEVSTEPIIQRWMLYMKSTHNFLMAARPGKEMKVVDYLTRMIHIIPTDNGNDCSGPCCSNNNHAGKVDPSVVTSYLSSLFSDDSNEPEDTFSHPTFSNLASIYSELIDRQSSSKRLVEMFLEVHNDTIGHCGAKKVWMRMNKLFPGHGFSYLEIATMVDECVTCQKCRLGHDSIVTPMTLNLRQPNIRECVGIDFLTITPTTKSGNIGVAVVVNQFTKLVALYPVKAFDAISAALSLLAYRCTYGYFRTLISDPGSHFTSNIMVKYNEISRQKHLLSLTNRHQSCGVERPNREILRHVTALCYDRRIIEWDAPDTLPLIQDIINNSINSETGYTPYTLTFGSDDAPIFNMPEPPNNIDLPDWVKGLNETLKAVRQSSLDFQEQLRKEREGLANESPNKFQPGDFVLFQLPIDKPKPTKITPRYKGPYEVLSHKRNSVECKHVVMHNIQTFHVGDLKLFAGTKEQAFEAALRDYDQYVVKTIHAYRGDPRERTSMQFQVEFSDGTILWKYFDKDLWECAEFERFCNANRPLQRLNRTADIANKEAAQRNREPITEVQPGDHVYVELRAFGFLWHDSLTLPQYIKPYVMACTYTQWSKNDNSKHLKIDISIDLLPKENQNNRSHDWVYTWGTNTEFNPNTMTLIDQPTLDEIIKTNPQFSDYSTLE